MEGLDVDWDGILMGEEQRNRGLSPPKYRFSINAKTFTPPSKLPSRMELELLDDIYASYGMFYYFQRLNL